MVHALHEIWRTLRTDGTLIDLRPVIGWPPIEIVTRQAAIRVGAVDDSSAAADSTAADRAIRLVVDTERFVSQHSIEFDFEHNWDSVAEMALYLDSRRHRMHSRPSRAELEEVFRSGGTQVRCWWRIKLDSYRRAGGTKQ